MINEVHAWAYCGEDISLIENYEKAINDKTQTWICHHKSEIALNKSKEELIAIGEYYHRPANELIFVTKSEHNTIHFRGRKMPETLKVKIGVGNRGKRKGCIPWNKSGQPKYKWETPTGEVVIMDKSNARHHHPDWKLLEKV